jgi:hypothetical protein
MHTFLNKKNHNNLKCIHNINTIFYYLKINLEFCRIYYLKINLEFYLRRSEGDRNKKSWNNKLNLFMYVFFNFLWKMKLTYDVYYN